jgi:hypothetical protein
MTKRCADKPDFRAIDRLVRTLPAPSAGNRVYKEPQLREHGLIGLWLTGLAPRVTAAGARAWTVGYRAGGIERRHTIGPVEAWASEAVWRETAELRRIVDQGGDPQKDRRTEREAPTLNDLADRFEQEHLPRLRLGTQDEYGRLLRIHIRPLWEGNAWQSFVTLTSMPCTGRSRRMRPMRRTALQPSCPR